MVPSDFPEKATTWNYPNGGKLPLYYDGKVMITLWRPSIKERFSALIFGKVWVSLRAEFPPAPGIGVVAARKVFDPVKGKDAFSQIDFSGGGTVEVQGKKGASAGAGVSGGMKRK